MPSPSSSASPGSTGQTPDVPPPPRGSPLRLRATPGGRRRGRLLAVAGVTEVDRQRVVDELERRAAAGELSPEELADRTRRARTVSTLAGLDGIVLDLPGASTDLPVHASHSSHSSHSGAAT